MIAIRRIAALSIVCAVVAAAGCLGNGPTDDPPVGQTEQALGSAYKLTTYYSSSGSEVGHCIGPSVCTGFNTECSGTKTATFDWVWEPC
jgi:hypothetical protein